MSDTYLDQGEMSSSHNKAEPEGPKVSIEASVQEETSHHTHQHSKEHSKHQFQYCHVAREQHRNNNMHFPEVNNLGRIAGIGSNSVIAGHITILQVLYPVTLSIPMRQCIRKYCLQPYNR